MMHRGYLGGLLYPNTRYPPIVRSFPRYFGQEIWSMSMRNFPLFIVPPNQPPLTQAELEVQDLKNQLAHLEERMDTQDRMFRFATRVTKKLTCIGQLSDQERQEALALGIFVLEPHPWMAHTWTLNESTSVDQQILRYSGGLGELSQENFSAQFPPEEHVPDSTTVLHTRAGNLDSETSIACVSGKSKMYLGNPIAEVIDHGVEPLVKDILVYFSSDDDDDEVPLNDYYLHLNQLDDRNNRINEKLKLSLKEALEIEKMTSDIVQRITDSRNRNSIVLQNVPENSNLTRIPTDSKQTLIEPIVDASANPDPSRFPLQ